MGILVYSLPVSIIVLELLLTPDIFALLCDRGSLTERFKQEMGVTPQLTKIRQEREFVSLEERRALSIKSRQMALVREIKMGDGEQDWLFARTVIPIKTLKGSVKRIALLNNAPLGKVLFGRNGAKRKSMQLHFTCNLPGTLKRSWGNISSPLWLRCSIFEFNTGPIMVTEVFLPGCPIYSAKNYGFDELFPSDTGLKW